MRIQHLILIFCLISGFFLSCRTSSSLSDGGNDDSASVARELMEDAKEEQALEGPRFTPKEKQKIKKIKRKYSFSQQEKDLLKKGGGGYQFQTQSEWKKYYRLYDRRYRKEKALRKIYEEKILNNQTPAVRKRMKQMFKESERRRSEDAKYYRRE